MIADRIRAWFQPRAAVARPDDPALYLRWLPVHVEGLGFFLNSEEAFSLAVVWGCMDVITKAIASCRWNVYTYDGKNNHVWLQDDPLDYVLNTRPNPDMTAIAMKEALLYSALPGGNGYGEILMDRSGRVNGIMPLDATRVTPRRDPQTWELYYEYSQPSGGIGVIPAWKMYHLKGPSLDGFLGDNRLARAAAAVGLAVAQQRFSTTYFGNNTVVGGVLEYPKSLDPKTHANLKKSWAENHQGINKAHNPTILENGMKWIPFQSDAEKAQLIESRKFQIEEICRFFGVPPHKVAHLDRATFNNIEHLGIEFVRDALTPWALRLQQEADFKLFSARGPARFTKLDMGWLSMGDFKTRMEGYAVARRIGAYSVNDILRKEGENQIGPEGDIRTVESAMIPLAQLEEFVESQIERNAAPKEAPPTTGAPGQGTGGAREALPGRPQDDQKGPSGDRLAARRRQLLLEAITVNLASALERYGRRLENRAADLRRKLPESRVLMNLSEEKDKLRPKLLEDCLPSVALLAKAEDVELPSWAVEGGVLAAADEVLNDGAEPREAAERLVVVLTQTAVKRSES